mmetsp:Transcript_960/g.2845  ORF Transcript_960/g.2845 Transcript_960/m.2845 type:complete len:201 (-) Transcript_960:2426-3028(-)
MGAKNGKSDGQRGKGLRHDVPLADGRLQHGCDEHSCHDDFTAKRVSIPDPRGDGVRPKASPVAVWNCRVEERRAEDGPDYLRDGIGNGLTEWKASHTGKRKGYGRVQCNRPCRGHLPVLSSRKMSSQSRSRCRQTWPWQRALQLRLSPKTGSKLGGNRFPGSKRPATSWSRRFTEISVGVRQRPRLWRRSVCFRRSAREN